MTNNRPCTCHPDDNPPQPCAERYALSECRQRTPPRIDVYEDAAMRLDMHGEKWIPTFLHGFMPQGITAEQAREAAHLLNQLAEWLDAQKKP